MRILRQALIVNSKGLQADCKCKAVQSNHDTGHLLDAVDPNQCSVPMSRLEV